MKKKDIFDSDDEEEEEENGQEEENEDEKANDEENSQESKEQEKDNNEAELTNKNTIELNEEKENEKEKGKAINKTLYGIFIMGLPYEVTEMELKNIFSRYGEIIKIKLPKYQNTNKNVGHCYIYYNNEQSAIKSLELNKRKLGKRYMEISLSKPITNHFKDNNSIDPDDVPLDCKTAFVKNLNYNITEEEVNEKFKNCGQINAITYMIIKHINLKDFVILISKNIKDF